METDGQKSDFRQRSSSRGARGGRGNFRGRGGSLERGRGKGGGFDGRGRGRGRGFGGRGGQRGQGRGGPRGRGRGGGSGERGQGRRGGFGGERSGRGFGGERRGRGFRGGRFLSQSSFRGGRTDFSGNDDGPLKNSGEKSNVQNNEMSNQRGGQGFVRGRGRGGRFSHSKDRQNEAQAEKTLENKSILVSKPRPEDVKRKYKLAPEETKKAVLLSNLPKKIESLHEEFKNFISSCIGPVKLITYRKVTTSKVAFVNAICIFEEASDFKLALENLHGQEFNGRHLLVQQFKNFKYDTHHTTKNCVCVTNMAEKIAEEDLWKLFEGCGTLGMIHINRNVSTGTPLEAIVNFKEPEGVTAALKLDGSEVLGSAVKVVQLDRSCSVLVANVNRQTTHQEFKELFSDCNIAYFTFAPKVKKELKSAFVYLADKEGHEQALSLNGVELKGCTLSVTSGTEKEAIPSYDIYLHLPPGAVPKEVTKAFSNFGEVLNVRIPFKKGISKVSFKEAKQAQAAASCSHVALNGDDVKVFASFGVALKDKKREKKKNNPVALSDKEVKQEKQKNSTLKKNSKNVKNFEALEANSDEDSDTEDTSIIKEMKMDETDESDVSGEEENMTNEGRFVKALVKTSRKNNNVHPIHKEVEVSEEESDSGLSDEDLMADVQEDGQEYVLAHSFSVPKKSKSQGKRKRRDSDLSKNLKNSKKLKKKL